ncbi:MAG: Tim44 domain-containing protein [Rhodobiaceae bacterium]|nr:Tim44 domain-containing protein [Rhodobiaceae bacterium]MCC0016045.1 Tim44 domain-containing protein [Rhodobiaceae bacterium]
MNHFFDIYTIIFLVVAVAIFLRLRSVLGRRTGSERPTGEQMARARDAAAEEGKVIPLPDRTATPASPVDTPDEQPEPKTPLERTLADIRKIDPAFSADTFLQGARSAYEMIVTAYAAGDRRTLRPLLSREVYDGFVTAIAERESRGEKVQSNFVGIDTAKLSDATLAGKTATLTVTFVSQMVTATLAANGAVLAGDPTQVSTVTDIWSFSRDISSRDPNWKLVSTESPEGDED